MTLKTARDSERGSMLLACLIITAMVLSGMVVYSMCMKVTGRANMTTLQTQKSYYLAESGLYGAIEWLKTPNAGLVNNLPESSQTPFDVGVAGATVIMFRDATDNSLVNIRSESAYHGTTGRDRTTASDPVHRAIVRAQVRVDSLGDYFAAVPGTLRVSPGSDISNGKIYGRDLVFLPGPDQTKVGNAYYYHTVTDGTNFNDAPANVTFTGSATKAEQTTSEVSIPRVSALDNFYKTLAPDADCQFTGNQTLTGNWNPPNNAHVCYFDGDLEIGGTQKFDTTSPVAIYVTGNIRIKNDVNPNGSGWVALLTQKDVIIDPQAPDHLKVHATTIADGAIRAEGGERSNGDLEWKGGLSAQLGISLTQFKKERKYRFAASPTTITLPYIVQTLSWRAEKGEILPIAQK